MSAIELTLVMPCLNEAATVARCVLKAASFLNARGIAGEIIVADNGSTDGSPELARAAGARVLHVQEKGYGAALRGGIAAAHGRFIIMGDADESYDFGALDAFVTKLRDGHDLVMGNRFAGGIQPGAMPFLHRYLGNPVLSFFGRLFFRVNVGDFHCGLRGFRKQAIDQLGLTSGGMEFASEMIVKAALAGLRITEVPTTLSPDGRGRPSHLRTWRDGWRHLRFLLIFSPRWLFLYPGLLLFAAGGCLQALLIKGGLKLGPFGLDIHTLLYAAAMSVMGVQMIWFAIFARVAGVQLGFRRKDSRLERLLEIFTLERGIVVGLTLFIGGIALSATAMSTWAATHYGALDPQLVMRVAIPAVSMMIVGLEFVLASFFIGVLRIERPRAALTQAQDDVDVRQTAPTGVACALASNQR